MAQEVNGSYSQPLSAQRAMPGSVCSGSLRDRDLISAFADELRRLQGVLEPSELVGRCRAALEGADEIAEDEASALLDELFDALDALAPEGHYFGAHPGDGVDFGFWPHDN